MKRLHARQLLARTVPSTSHVPLLYNITNLNFSRGLSVSSGSHEQKEKDEMPPLGFSWVIEDQIGGMALPQSPKQLRYLSNRGVRLIVTLTESPLPATHDPELVFAPDYLSKLKARLAPKFLHLPVADYGSPSMEQMIIFAEEASSVIKEGGSVVAHCHMGIGRTGTMIACYLVSKGMDPHVAIQLVRDKRPGSITRSQEQAVHIFAKYGLTPNANKPA